MIVHHHPAGSQPAVMTIFITNSFHCQGGKTGGDEGFGTRKFCSSESKITYGNKTKIDATPLTRYFCTLGLGR
jgi:hypothetical protein